MEIAKALLFDSRLNILAVDKVSLDVMGCFAGVQMMNWLILRMAGLLSNWLVVKVIWIW